jgi:hypothetical protein
MARPDPEESRCLPGANGVIGIAAIHVAAICLAEIRDGMPSARQRRFSIGCSMKSQSLIAAAADLESLRTRWSDLAPDLVFCFCAPDIDLGRLAAARVSAAFPRATVIGCSTAGEIGADGVCDGLVSLLGLSFRDTMVRAHRVSLDSHARSAASGRLLGDHLLSSGAPAAVLPFIPGLGVDGSAFVHGLRAALPAATPMIGGMAADGRRFGQTFTIIGNKVFTDQAVAVGLYGTALRIGIGSASGWTPFGPTRRVTGADGPVLIALDRKPALQLYCNYLGDRARDLPSSGMLYPLALVGEGDPASTGLIRSIMAVDWEAGTLTLAGAVAPGSLVRLMHADNDGLIDGARLAAERVLAGSSGSSSGAAVLMVSCVGRRDVLGDDIDDEIDAVRTVFPAGTPMAGFYSYGEIGPHGPDRESELHNQTMTIASFSEI